MGINLPAAKKGTPDHRLLHDLKNLWKFIEELSCLFAAISCYLVYVMSLTKVNQTLLMFRKSWNQFNPLSGPETELSSHVEVSTKDYR